MRLNKMNTKLPKTRPSPGTRATPLPAPASGDLSPAEADAYAALVAASLEHATDRDKRRLAKAGLLPDASASAPPTSTPQLPAAAGDGSSPAADEHAKSAAAPAPVQPSICRAAVSPTSGAREKAIRYLVARASGSNFRAALALAGAEWLDIQRYRWSDPQFAVVQDFIDRERAAILSAKASDALEALIDGDETAAARNAKAVLFTLERLRRDQFSNPDRGGGSPSGNGGGVVYNITFSAGANPAVLCSRSVANPLDPAVIDLKTE